MSDRSLPFNEAHKCDKCGRSGAFDFYGDFLCPSCAMTLMPRNQHVKDQFGEDTNDAD